MANKMLIDATHPEETRVVVVRGNRVEEFDFESASRKQLRGNIYLAKVTRVEPSLQAAFVEYGGNRHGFLAFSEIHPDYYQIPVADRLALIEQDEREAREAEAEADRRSARGKRRGRPDRKPAGRKSADTVSEAATEAPEANADDTPRDEAALDLPEGTDETADAPVVAASDDTGEDVGGPLESAASGEEPEESAGPPVTGEIEEVGGDEDEEDEEDAVESVGSEDAMEEIDDRRFRPRRQYKIQEVIKRRQVMLVQVVKEERGTKGAALTTYLSLAGRYSVLMPNTARGGGISRKITSAQDRKRLKTVVQDLEVPEGMGVILRTAGANRTKTEIKRDFEYLLRMWETVRDLTLRSHAPTLVYEEGSLIKRSIRDLYNKDIDEVLVAGEDGYREAKDFMRMLMPSHAKNVKPYREVQPVFTRNGIESQLDAMFSPVVQLRSGGYIVMNQTEALVAIDVNSGRATREHNIEDTALKTNLEAAEEVARQLRLRDLAGLIVVDFIDMDEKRNNRAVERRMKDALKNDRARIQVGRISHFGLLEMSRQRIRTGVLESSTIACPTCGGTGHLRSDASTALQVLRALEDMLLKSATHDLIVRTRHSVALYVLNHKRAHLRELEERFGVAIIVQADESVTGHQPYALEKGDLTRSVPVQRREPLPPPAPEPEDLVEEIDEDEEDGDEEDAQDSGSGGEQRARAPRDSEGEGDGGNRRRRRRRRRRRGGEGERGTEDGAPRLSPVSDESGEVDETEAEDQAEGDGEDDAEGGTPASADGASREDNDRRRRRGRRGGRRNRRDRDAPREAASGAPGDEVNGEAAPDLEIFESRPVEPPAMDDAPVFADAEPAPVMARPEPKPEPKHEPVAKTVATPAAATPAAATPAPAPEPVAAEPPRRSTVREAPPMAPASNGDEAPAASGMPAEPARITVIGSEDAPSQAEAPRRGGWWSRKPAG
jgi:ribonuclease E